MIGALLGLEDVVARNAPVGPGDARRTKNALAQARFLAWDGFAGGDFPSEGMFAGLKSFQRANGLREDAAMKPGGADRAAAGECLSSGLTRGSAGGRPGSISPGRWGYRRPTGASM